MHVRATSEQARIVLSAMLAVASAGSEPTDADRASIAAAARYIFRLKSTARFRKPFACRTTKRCECCRRTPSLRAKQRALPP